jgi:hypothetical protein
MQGVILVGPPPADDPILPRGTSPVTTDEQDAAENHDRYTFSRQGSR